VIQVSTQPAPIPAAPTSSQEEMLSPGDLLRFIYTCPLAMLMTTKDGGVRLLSAGAVSLLMPFSRDGAIDNLFELLEIHAPRLREVVQSALTGPARRLEGHRIKVAPGDPSEASWLEVNAVAFDDGYSFVCHDVSAVVDREQRGRAAAAEEAHLRGKVETATAILHDLGNVLTGIGSRAVEVRRHAADASVGQNLKRATEFLRPHAVPLDAILGAAGRGKALVGLLASMATATERTQSQIIESLDKLALFLSHAQELLEIHRTYAGPGRAASQGRSSVDRILIDVRSMMESAMTKRGGALTIKAARGPLPAVRVDRSKLLQVLLNLVKNAAEAFDGLPPGGMRQVELSADLGASGGLAITVRDNGPGFSAALAQRLFEDGFSTKNRGSGVGLGACRRIIESFGGELTLTSDGPGNGALARVALPREVISHDAD
jgi:signal transduction histidine kinase